MNSLGNRSYLLLSAVCLGSSVADYDWSWHIQSKCICQGRSKAKVTHANHWQACVFIGFTTSTSIVQMLSMPLIHNSLHTNHVICRQIAVGVITQKVFAEIMPSCWVKERKLVWNMMNVLEIFTGVKSILCMLWRQMLWIFQMSSRTSMYIYSVRNTRSFYYILPVH